jgi:radical SAM superfamily enzyme YgiQ (UPF0313 family)
MNALLLYPEFPDTFWSFKHALKFIRKKASLPPLGLVTVAAVMPERWQKRLVDVNTRKLTAADLEWADLAFIGGMAVQSESAKDLIARCQKGGVRIVAGGPLFTIERERFPQVDHFVLNEAELTLPAFVADLEAGRAKRLYTTSELADMRASPVPRWELADLPRYATMSVQYSRGCPYNCEFCNVTALFGHRPRTKSAEQIVAELDRLYELGWRSGVFFVDDNLIGDRKHLKQELLPALIEWRRDKRGMSFSTEVSINLADDEDLMQAMAQAGFVQVFIGIETPDEGSLAECSKKTNLNRDLVEDVKRIQRAGMQVQGGFIVGFDHDAPSIFRRQIEFIQRSGIVTAMVGLLQAPPGTKLYERMKREGRLLDRMTGDNVDGTTNIVPIMNLDKLREGYRSIMRHIYSPEHYYERIMTFLREYKAPSIRMPLNLKVLSSHVLALFRSIYHLGILGQERVHYWKLLLWTLFRRPRLFPHAVTFAVYGYHFRKVCEQRVLADP